MTELKCNSKGACRHHEFSEITLDKKCNCYDWWVECDWGKDFNPQPQPDELGKLIEELGNGIYIKPILMLQTPSNFWLNGWRILRKYLAIKNITKLMMERTSPIPICVAMSVEQITFYNLME